MTSNLTKQMLNKSFFKPFKGGIHKGWQLIVKGGEEEILSS